MKKIKLQIKNRWTGSIIFEYEKENNTIAKTVKEYIRQEVEIRGKSRADLSEADLSEADLSEANLSMADLSEADLSRADLSRANLSAFKNDIWAILLRSNEVDYLIKALKNGKVNGSVYEGECCCLVGTIANSKGCKYNDEIKLNGLKPDSDRPAERWFMQIQTGQTPKNNNAVKLTVEWIEEFKTLLAAQKSN